VVGAVHDQVRALEAMEHSSATASLDEFHFGQLAPTGESHDAHSVATGHLERLTSAQRGRALRVYRWIYILSLVTAFLTAVYTFRAYFMTFHGPYRVPTEAAGHAHESPRSMWIPLTVLAGFAAVIGLVLDRTHAFANILGQTPSLSLAAILATPRPGVFHMNVAVLSTAVAVAGVSLSAFLYLGPRSEVAWIKWLLDSKWLDGMTGDIWISGLRESTIFQVARKWGDASRSGWLVQIVGFVVVAILCVLALPLLVLRYLSPYKLSRDKFYLDELYEWLLVKPLRGLAALSDAVDRWLIDGCVNLCGWLPTCFGDAMRQLHIGLLPFYALAMTLGIVTLLVARAVWGG